MYIYGQGEKNAQSLDKAFNSKYMWNIFTFLHTSPPHSLAFTLPLTPDLTPHLLLTLHPIFHSSLCPSPIPHPTSPFTLTPYPSPYPSPVVPDQECPAVLEADNLPDDLFSVFFKCQSHSCPWRALLAYAIALQRPLLAILAACDKVHVCTAYDCI